MTGSRADPPTSLRNWLVAVSLLLMPVTASAQSQLPTTTLDSVETESNAIVEDVVPLQLLPTELPSVDQPVDTQTIEEDGTGFGIDVQALDRLDPDATGILDAATGGFPVDMWTGTPRHRLELLLSLMPQRLSSPALQSTARRLLLSRAAVPVSFAAEGEPRSSILLTRVDKLTGLGLFEDAAALLDAAPLQTNPVQAGAIAERQSKLALLAGDMPKACAAMLSMVDGSEAKRRLNLTCQALAGNQTEAGFGAELIAEEGNPDDDTYLALLDHLNGGPQPSPSRLQPQSPLEFAMIRAAGLPLAASSSSEATPLMNRVRSSFPSETPEQRIALLWHAHAEGSVGLDAVTAALRAIEFDAETLANALTRAVELGPWRMSALVYQAALAQTAQVTRAEVIGGSIILAEDGDHRRLLETVFAPLVAEIRVDRGLIWFAEDAASLLYRSGRTESAQPWFELLRTEGLQSEAYDQAALVLWPYAAIAGDSSASRLGRDVALRWIQHIREAEPDRAKRGVSFVLALLESLGTFVPQAAWDAALAEPSVGFNWTADPATIKALRVAAQEGRLGESVSLAVITLGAGDLTRIDAGVLVETVSLLRELNQENLARAIASDALAARY